MEASLLTEYARLVLDAAATAQSDVHLEFSSVVRQLMHNHSQMDSFINIAHQRIPSSDGLASFRWRMLYIDASILKVLARASIPGLQEDVARECISTLDHAIIIAGAAADDARRDYIVHDVIKQLQSVLPWCPPSGAVFLAKQAPVHQPLSTSRKSICTLTALPSIATAQRHWSRAPFVVRGYADDWPAMHQPQQWASLSYLSSVAGPGRVVPVEVGDDYRSDDWSQKLISWENFLSSLDPSASAAHRQHQTIYLAQHSLLTQFPQLREDIIPPDIVYACLDSPDFPAYQPPPDVIVNAWLGPKGTISPAHTDPFFNCYVQVVGRKTVWLAPPSVAAAMYPYQSSPSGADRSHNPAANTTSPLMSNTSRVDVFPAYLTRMPDEASCVTLSPGDLLFFPPGWWHAMRSEDLYISLGVESSPAPAQPRSLSSPMSSSDADRVVGHTSPFPSSGRSGALSPSPSASLTDQHLAEALANSPDNGATLDFTHKSLTDVGEDGAERLATVGRSEFSTEQVSITRIALGYNRLATLPTAFALLSCLRYLNLKNNSFSVFPDVLTVIPSLEILDISRNKIKRLPTQPGSLSKLHVLCISRNRITRLPGYLADFGSLDVLKVDHNPIEWPPKPTIEMTGSANDPQAVKGWILALQKWLRENSQPRLDIKPKPSAESFMSDRAALNHSIEESLQSWTALAEEDCSGGPTPHARTFCIDDHFPLPPIPLPSRSAITLRFERPPPLRLGSLPPCDPPPRSSSPESYLPTPAESASSTDDDHTAVPDGFQYQTNGSFTRGGRDRRPALFGKKSIPDLRASPRFGDQGHSAQSLDSAASIIPLMPSSRTNGTLRDDFTIPPPLSHRQDSSSSSSEGSSQQKTHKQCTTTPPSSASPTSAERPHPVPDTEGHAYFKRLSALPANAIANNLSASITLSVYQALSHYITYTINQKLSSVLRKVTDPAFTYMTQLNGALERFDTVAKKTTPPPLLCRALVESSRDTAAVFGKAIAMLSLQLKILASNDDDRFMRSLVLVFYGATAEISHAWRSMIPHIEAIKPHLSDPRRIASCKTKCHTMVPPALNIDSSLSSANVGPSQLSGFLHNIPIARSRPTPTTLGRVRTSRRHAGSFSSKDVEIGKSLPSYDLPLLPTLPNGTSPTTRHAGQKAPPVPLSASTFSLVPSSTAGGTTHGVPPPMPASLPPRPTWTARNGYHSRQASQASLTASPSSPSPQVPLRRPMLEIPLSRTLVDNDALNSMETAVNSAPAIWELMQEMVETMSEAPGSSGDFRDSIDRAKIVTEHLRVNIVTVRAGDPSADRGALRDNAHLFVKIVVKLSNFIKTYGSSHAVFPELRSKMVALTNSTQEFVMLLHVSSFSPSSTPLPYSPITSSPVHSTNAIANFRGLDDKLGASLMRSWSTHQPKTLQLVAPGSANLPRNALPSQSQFHIPISLRYAIPVSGSHLGHSSGETITGDNIADEG
ncbi:hypothetical protein J3R82DRAFT_5358 [Butyriboletus roseoflavus]|nr:hypothetical protein J3R82DRAFT_5358 [Butyriboletus roseoflavus]